MLTPGVYDLTVYQGATFDFRFTWQTQDEIDPEVWNPVDLSGCTARLHIRPKAGSLTLYHDATTENGGITLGGTAGTVDLLITDEDTALLTFKSGVYDLEIE